MDDPSPKFQLYPMIPVMLVAVKLIGTYSQMGEVASVNEAVGRAGKVMACTS